MTTLLLNDQLKGVELYFDGKPMQEVLNTLKSIGFRWNGKKVCWYAKQSAETIAEAEKIVKGNSAPIVTEVKPVLTIETVIHTPKAKTISFNLWNATQWKNEKVNMNLETKEIAQEIRKHIKIQFPTCKFSVRSDYNSIDFDIVSTPYEKDSIYLKAIQEYCSSLIKAYKYCTCDDPYGDYGSSYNFYGARCDISYKYEKSTTTEEVTADILNYDVNLLAFEAAEEERKEKEYRQREIERAENNKIYEARQIQIAQEEKAVNAHVTVAELETINQYMIIGSQFANLNKNNTLDEYKEEIAKGDYYLQNVKVTKEIHFSDPQILGYFSSMLMHKFDFISGTGGSYTDDLRITSMVDHDNMTQEEQKTVVFNSLGVAIYLNNELQFVVDAQGYSYARYIGLVDHVTVTEEYIFPQVITPEQVTELKAKAETLEDYSVEVITQNNLVGTWNNSNWIDYKEALKATLKAHQFKLSKSIIQQLSEDSQDLKVAMYKLLVEVDSLQEQFKNSNIKQGDKITMFYIGDMGGMITSRVTVDKIEFTKYAQYDNAIKITLTPQGKRKQYYNFWYGDMLVYNGWLELPETVLHEVKQSGSFTVTSSKFMSCDKKQYGEIINHFITQDITPVVNTHKPIM